MTTDTMLTFRSFLTERFTAVAVEIFEEVGNIVEEFHQENTRLRSLLHMVLSPEIKLTHIDVSNYTRASGSSETRAETTGERRQQPAELNNGVNCGISEPLPKKPKEEQTEYDIGFKSEAIQEQVGAGTTVNPDWVKNDPDGDEDMASQHEIIMVQVSETNGDSEDTFSADEISHEHEESLLSDLDSASEYSKQLSSSEGSSEGSGSGSQRTNDSSKKKRTSKKGLQKTLLELPRLKPMMSVVTELPDYKSFCSRITEVYKDFPEDEKPLITTMDLTADVKMVDCALGKVPVGSPLSYHCPVPSSRDYKPHNDAPSQPSLPLPFNRLKPVSTPSDLTLMEQEHITNMQTTWDIASRLEHSTREHSESVEELRKLRLTCRFMEICKFRPEEGEVERLISKIKKGPPRCKTVQVERETKTEALREYCQRLSINWYPCGLVVHPNAPWLGALPDGLAYDPHEKPAFGLVHVKCIWLRSFVNCGFLVCKDGLTKLQTNHECYWHIQGEMMVTGASWCDLLVCSKEDLMVQRIYRDKSVIGIMRTKLPKFFFRHYLKSLFNTDATA